MLRHHGLSHHSEHGDWCLTSAPLAIQLPANAPGKAAEDGPHGRPRRSCQLPAAVAIWEFTLSLHHFAFQRNKQNLLKTERKAAGWVSGLVSGRQGKVPASHVCTVRCDAAPWLSPRGHSDASTTRGQGPAGDTTTEFLAASFCLAKPCSSQAFGNSALSLPLKYIN